MTASCTCPDDGEDWHNATDCPWLGLPKFPPRKKEEE